MDRILKNRIKFYIVIPFLITVQFLFNDIFWIRVIASALILIYTAFIIFLRNNLEFRDRSSSFEDPEDKYDEPVDEGFVKKEPRKDYSSDFEEEEGFSIISPNKNLEVATYGSRGRSLYRPVDLKEKFDEIANEELPKNLGHDGQFQFVLEKILNVIKESYMAYSVIFFWYNKNKEKLTIQSSISTSKDIDNRKYDLENDILSAIVQKGEPEILSDISPVGEADAIRYYNYTQGIKSFVGVPVFFNKNLIGVLAVDSKAPDAFGIETIYTLGRYVRIITMMISLFDEKHTESTAQQRLKALLSLIPSNKKFESEEDLISSIQDAVTGLVNFDAFAFIYFNPVEQKFKTVKIINNTSLKYVGEFLEIDLNSSVAGKTILTALPIKIDDTSEEHIVRYSKKESVSFDGSFMAIPIIYGNQIYGVFCFESLKKNTYSNSDVNFLKSSITVLAYLIYSYSTQKLLKNLLAVDVETKTLNSATFKERLKADLEKAEALSLLGSFCIIKIDDFLEQDSLFEQDPFPSVLKAIVDEILPELSSFNLIGRLSDRTFGLYFFNYSTKDVFLWLEKLRMKVARKPIAVVSKQTTYTISAGLVSTTGKTNIDELIVNANLALQKAVEKGGNKVININ